MDVVPRKSSLDDALKAGLVVTGGDLERSLVERDPEASLTTQVDALDELGPGGLKSGRLVQIVGQGSSGRFSLVLSALYAATHAGDSAAILDYQHHFDPQEAERAGIQLERLLWMSPQTIPQTLLSAELLLQAGFFLVVIDFGLLIEIPLLPNAVWMRLSRVAEEHKAIVVLSSPTAIETTACDALLYSEKTESEWSGVNPAPTLLSHLILEWRLRARRGPRRERTIHMRLQA